jgi:hypothetical protein
MNLFKLITYSLLFLSSLTLLSACHNERKSKRPSFAKILGKSYFEVRRTFENGIAFDSNGVYLEPKWVINFSSDSTVKIGTETVNEAVTYPMYYSHDSVFNFGRQYFRIKTIENDSLVFQLLNVDGGIIYNNRSNIYTTFYAEGFIKNRLKRSLDDIRRPTRSDSLFIHQRSLATKHDPDNFFFAATPVVLKSKNANVHIKRLKEARDPLSAKAENYLNLSPGYEVTVNNAYKNFTYDVLVTIDETGRISFNKFLIFVMPEFIETKTRIIEALVDGYLNEYLAVTPGATLGINHSCALRIRLVGKSDV